MARSGRRFSPAGALALVVFLAPVGQAQPPATSTAVLEGKLSGLPEGAFASGRTFARTSESRTRRTKLDRSIRGFLTGAGLPWARLDRKGRILAYETWWAPAEFDQENSLEAQGVEPGDRLGSPRIRVRSLAEGRERFFERGSRSPSFRSDGAIAYTVGDDPFARSQRPFLTHVRVRRTFRQAPRTWSRSPGRYTVLGWAGRRLLVERSIPAGFPELLVFDGPRRERSLGSGVNLVAVRPDGQALLVRRPREVQVRVLSTNDGSLLAAGDLAEPVFGIGHWLGEFVAVATQGGMAILRVQTDRVESVQSFAIPSGRSLQQPRFVGEDAFSAWTSGGGDDSRPNSATLYRCTLATPSCVAREFPLRSLPRPVFDVSRP